MIIERAVITIVCMGPSHAEWLQQTPYGMAQFGEVWTINCGGRFFPHDMLFDMHTNEWLERHRLLREKKRRLEYMGRTKPVVMPYADPDIPCSVAYPLQEVIELTGDDYFACGPSYMLALALVSGCQNLKLYGLDFSAPHGIGHSERGRACCEYWAGRLIQSGTHVEVAKTSQFMAGADRTLHKLYGY
jgi:hypothetical protein